MSALELRRVQHQLGDEVARVGRLVGGGDELIEVLDAQRAVGIAQPDQRREHVAQALGARPGPRLRARLDERGDQRVGARARPAGISSRATPSREPVRAGDRLARRPRRPRRVDLAAAIARRHRRDRARALTGPTPSTSCSTRNQATSSAPLSTSRSSRDEVLDVRGLQVAQAAVLVERDPPAGELELEQVGVVRRARQHGLRAQLGALLARLEDAVADLLGLRGLVAHVDDPRPHAALAVGAQALRERARRPARRARWRRPAPAAWSGSCAPASPPACPGSARGSRGCARPRPSGSRRSPGSRRRPRSPRGPCDASDAREVHLQAVDVLVLVDQHVVERRGQQRPDHLVGASARQNSSRSSRSTTPELALARRVGLEQRRDRLAVLLDTTGSAPRCTPDSGCCALTVRE